MLRSTVVLSGAVLGCVSEVIMHPGYDYKAIREKFQGPVLPVVTNYFENLSVDGDAIYTNVDNVVSRGLVTGDAIILAAAAGGDFPRMTKAQRKQTIDATMKAVGQRAPVIVSVQDANVEEMVEMAQYCESIGVDAIQVSPPYYYPCTLEDFNRTIALVMANTKSIPVAIYNTPWEYNPSAGTAMDLGVPELEMLTNTWPRIQLLKWASKDTDKYTKVIHAFKDRLAIIDNGGMWPTSYMLGATGFISHWANVYPEWNVKVHRMLKAGAFQEASDLIIKDYWPWSDFRSEIWARTASESIPVKGALDMLEGRVGGATAQPTRRLNAQEVAELAELLKKASVPGLKVPNSNYIRV